MLIHVEGQKAPIEISDGANGLDLAVQLKLTGPHEALCVKKNGILCDTTTSLKDGDRIQFFSFSSPEGQEAFWHTSTHVLAQAVIRKFPNARPTIGPAIEQGFYHDFADLTISESDLPAIEEEMEKIIHENFKTECIEFSSKEETLKFFKYDNYKKELVADIPEGERITAYRQGEFVNLCRGPHLPNLGKIKSIKLLKTSGAYWRGDSKNAMLTRIYGISFPDKKMLKEYLFIQEEAKKRDHKILGPKYGLFSLHEEAPGIPFLHPKGIIVWNRLIDFWRKIHRKEGYFEIKTPSLMTKDLWEISGHWANYRQNMFITSQEEREFALKPMNCPGCMIFYKEKLHSYRDFPLRLAEIGFVHRFEPSGSLAGLFRVRAFHQDDAHVFLTIDQLQDEVARILNIVDQLYSPFGLNYELALSTRPDKQTIGSDETWELSTNGLKKALESLNRPYKINEGDGAFYGPKIDCYIQDALGRKWQCGTIQLDMALPERFNLEYTAQDGTRKRPLMLHRALLGSLERFFGSLIEFYAGRFPFWISPSQIRILTVAERHLPFAEELRAFFEDKDFAVDIDRSNESVGKKIRDAQLEQYNYILTIGDKEVESKTLSVRTRDGVVHSDMPLQTFVAAIDQERATKSLHSPLSTQQ